MASATNTAHREPWNKGKIVGQKAPFKLKDIWALRVRLQMEHRVRELALFNLGIDSKLRGCDLVALKVRDVCHGDQMATRAIVMQHKTQRPVQFEITLATREALQAWIKQAELKPEDFLFPSRLHASPHLGTRQYARILGHWVDELGLDRADYGTHSMRRTKATLMGSQPRIAFRLSLIADEWLGNVYQVTDFGCGPHDPGRHIPRKSLSKAPKRLLQAPGAGNHQLAIWHLPHHLLQYRQAAKMPGFVAKLGVQHPVEV